MTLSCEHSLMPRPQFRKAQSRLADVERENARTKEHIANSIHQQTAELQAELNIKAQELKSREQEMRLKDQHIENVEKQLKYEKEQSQNTIASLGSALETMKFVS